MLLRAAWRVASAMLAVNLAGLVAFGGWLVLGGDAATSTGAWILAVLIGVVLVVNVAICFWAVSLRKNAPVYEEAFVSLILDSVDAAITVYDASGKLLRANKACRKALWLQPGGVAGSGGLARDLAGRQTLTASTPSPSGRRADDYPIINENYWMNRVVASGASLRWSNVALNRCQGPRYRWSSASASTSPNSAASKRI